MGRGWFTGPGIGVLNGIFLRLDCTNDPLTAGLEVNAATAGEPVLTLLTTDDNITNPYLDLTNSGTPMPYIIEKDGTRFLHTRGTQSLFLAEGAGNFTLSGGYNTVVGYEAGMSLSSASYATLYGWYAGRSLTTGSYNVFLGTNCGRFTTTAIRNTAIGHDAGRDNINGTANFFLGIQAGMLQPGGDLNCFVGSYTGRSCQVGYNTFIGSYAGYLNTTGTQNLFAANQAGQNATTGSYNVLVGPKACLNLQVGSNMVAVGYEAGHGAALHNKSGCVLIGYQAGYNETLSNRLYIANSNTATPLVYGEFDNLFMRNYAASALTVAISNPLRTAHVTSGGALALFGVGHLHELQDGAGNLQTASEAVTLWAVATDDAEMPLRRWTTYPAGNAGPGYGGYITANDVDNVAQTIIPNGTGDVVCVLSVLYAVCVSDGNTAGGATTVNNGANVALYNVGGNTLTLAVAADGSVTVQRTADAGAGLTYDVSLLMSWI